MDNPPPYNQHDPQPGYSPPPQPGYGAAPQPGYGPPPYSYPPQAMGGYQGGQGCQPPQPGFSSQTNNTTTVVLQQQPQVVTTIIPVVNNHMRLSISACLCFCWPIGIFAICKSCQASNRYVAGDYAGAEAAALSARNLAYASIICGTILYIITIAIKIYINSSTI